MQQLRGLDTFMALGETHNMPMHIGALLIYKTRKKHIYDEGRELIEAQINEHLPILKCKLDNLALDIDRPYWVEDKHFNIDYHLQRVALPQPADQQTLFKLTASFYAKPLSKERPLWEAMIIEGLDSVENIPKGSIAIVLKIHHAVADGKTAMRIFSALHSETKAANAPLIVDSLPLPKMDFSAPSLLRKYITAYLHNRYAPQNISQNFVNVTRMLAVDLGKDKFKQVFKKADNNSKKKPSRGVTPRTIFNGELGAGRVIGNLHMPIKELKKLEKKTGATINDIALCIVSGALRDYLKKQKALPEKELVSGMPISIRGKKDDTMLGNKVSFSVVNLYSTIADPLVRLQAIHDDTHHAKKNNPKAHGTSYLELMDSFNPGAFAWVIKKIIDAGLLEKLPPFVNTVVSNVPGTDRPVYFCGAELVDCIPLGLITPTMTLFHAVSGTHKHVNISFLGCSSSLPDPEHYQAALEKSWQGLLDKAMA